MVTEPTMIVAVQPVLSEKKLDKKRLIDDEGRMSNGISVSSVFECCWWKSRAPDRRESIHHELTGFMYTAPEHLKGKRVELPHSLPRLKPVDKHIFKNRSAM